MKSLVFHIKLDNLKQFKILRNQRLSPSGCVCLWARERDGQTTTNT